MSLDANEQLAADANEFAKANRKHFARKFTDPAIFTPEECPVSVFMAGSPGAGKTEASHALIEQISSQGPAVLRIDPDDLRQQFKGYNGSNAYLFQRAASILVERILDEAFGNSQSFILDGTLSSYSSAKKNIDRSLKKDRQVQLLYVYQEPFLAWDFVQKREAIEGRRIKPETFIEQYFAAREVVNRLKNEYGSAIKVDLLMKNIDNSNRFFEFGVQNIDYFIPERFSKAELEQTLGLG